MSFHQLSESVLRIVLGGVISNNAKNCDALQAISVFRLVNKRCRCVSNDYFWRLVALLRFGAERKLLAQSWHELVVFLSSPQQEGDVREWSLLPSRPASLLDVPDGSSRRTALRVANLEQCAATIEWFEQHLMDTKKTGLFTNMHVVRGSLRRYHRFLQLCAWYPEAIIVPTEDIEMCWQSHVIRPTSYRRDCLRLFGVEIPHRLTCSPVETLLFEKAVQETAQLYQKHFQTDYLLCPPVFTPLWKGHEPVASASLPAVARRVTRARVVFNLTQPNGSRLIGPQIVERYEADAPLADWQCPFRGFFPEDVMDDRQWFVMFRSYVDTAMEPRGFHAGPLAHHYDEFLEDVRQALAARDSVKAVRPIVSVDIFWHAHLMSSRQYIADCQEMFGEILQHIPWPENFGL